MLLGELHMFKVLHQQSGVCLFTHRWKWKPEECAEGVDALVISFTQFARETDGKGAGRDRCIRRARIRSLTVYCI